MEAKKEARHLSRIATVGALFAHIVRGDGKDPKKCLRHVIQEVMERKKDEFAEELFAAALENFGKAKVIIRAFAPEFSFEKIAPINRAILVAGVCEMKFLDTPPIVVINEYIEIAKEYGEERSAGFISGVLDAFRKSIGKERGDVAQSEQKEE